MKNPIIKFSLIGGLLVSILFLGPIVIYSDKYMDPEAMASGEVIGYTIMILSMLSVFFGVRSYRNSIGNDPFSFSRALGVGLKITLLANLIFYAANVLLYTVISPDFLSEFGAAYKEYLVANTSTEEEKTIVISEFEAQAGMLSNPYLYALVMAGSTFFIGIIISLISALSLKRDSV